MSENTDFKFSGVNDDDEQTSAPSNWDSLHDSADNQPDSMYDLIRTQLAKPAGLEPLVLPVTTRPGVSLKFDVALDVDLFQAWVKRATNRRTKQTSARHLANTVLSNLHRGTLMNGKEVFTPSGDPLVIPMDEFAQLVGNTIGGVGQTITKLYGSDGFVLQHMRKILDAAGLGDEEEDWSDEFSDEDSGPFEN